MAVLLNFPTRTRVDHIWLRYINLTDTVEGMCVKNPHKIVGLAIHSSPNFNQNFCSMNNYISKNAVQFLM